MSSSKNSPKVYVIRSPFRPMTFSIHRHSFANVVLVGWKLNLIQIASSSLDCSNFHEQTAVSAYINKRLGNFGFTSPQLSPVQ